MTALTRILTEPELASLTAREARLLRTLRRWRLACVYYGPGEARVHVTRRGRVVLGEWADSEFRSRRKRFSNPG